MEGYGQGMLGANGVPEGGEAEKKGKHEREEMEAIGAAKQGGMTDADEVMKWQPQ